MIKPTMVVKVFPDKIILRDRKDVLKVHLYLKFIQHGIQPFENDIDIVLELFLFGGYKNSSEQDKFFKLCLEKNYRKSEQSIRNALSKYTSIGVLEKPKNTVLNVSPKFIPLVSFDKLVLQHTVTHAV